MARDSSTGFRQGYHTFLYHQKKYNQGSGRKRTNEQMDLGQLQVEETPTEATRNANSSLTSFLTASFCWPLSTLDC